jgi:hypothetical protein
MAGTARRRQRGTCGSTGVQSYTQFTFCGTLLLIFFSSRCLLRDVHQTQAEGERVGVGGGWGGGLICNACAAAAALAPTVWPAGIQNREPGAVRGALTPVPHERDVQDDEEPDDAGAAAAAVHAGVGDVVVEGVHRAVLPRHLVLSGGQRRGSRWSWQPGAGRGGKAGLGAGRARGDCRKPAGAGVRLQPTCSVSGSANTSSPSRLEASTASSCAAPPPSSSMKSRLASRRRAAAIVQQAPPLGAPGRLRACG